MRSYKLHMVQALRAGDRAKRVEFSSAILRDMEDDNFLPRLIFSDKTTFHISSKVNCHNIRIWGLENPLEILEHCCDSPKVSVFCAVFLRVVYELFFLEENTISKQTYLELLEQWLFPRINEDFENFTFQQDGAPLSWHRDVRSFPSETLTQRWTDRTGTQDLALHLWPPRSPDLTPCDFSDEVISKIWFFCHH